jgi:hypothetical protein
VSIGSWAEGAVTALPHTTAEQRYRAARRVATEAASATEAAELLAMLGLTPGDGLRPARAESGPRLREPA